MWVAHPGVDRLDDGRGLAGARTGQHQQRPRAMGHDLGLLGIQDGRGRGWDR